MLPSFTARLLYRVPEGTKPFMGEVPGRARENSKQADRPVHQRYAQAMGSRRFSRAVLSAQVA